MADDQIDEKHLYEDDGLRQKPLNSASLKELFVGSADIIFHDVLIQGRSILFRRRSLFGVTLAYFNGLANQKIIDDNIVRPLTESGLFKTCCSLSEAYRVAQEGALQISGIAAAGDTAQAVASMLSGKTLLCFDKLKKILILDTIQYEKRAIESAKEESTFRSAKESFVEALRVNMSMLRRKIGSASLVLEETTVGRQSNTSICIAYMRNICNETFIKQVLDRIGQINQDRVISMKDIEINVTQYKYSMLPTSLVTEKPEVCVRHLHEGKIAVIISELPYAVIFPVVFSDFFKSSEDYSGSFIFSTMFRILRFLCMVLAITLPGFYVAVTLFHPEMIPYELANRIVAASSSVPYPVYIEAVVMSLAFFTLLQASIMISQSVGSAISIVGGLVLGQAGIVAGLVSPGIIVVVAAASICSLTVPTKEISGVSWILQLLCTVLCAFLGLLGIVLILLTLLYMMARLEPLGVPYIAPYAGTKKLQLDDSLVLFPDNLSKKRPEYLEPKNKRRMP